MSCRYGVPSLSNFALRELASLIVYGLGQRKNMCGVTVENGISLAEIKLYLENAGTTSHIYQDLLGVILSSRYLKEEVRMMCLQMLLNSGVLLLVTDKFPYSYTAKVLGVISEQGTRLRVLNLTGVYVQKQHMPYMIEVIKKCVHLSKLYVPDIADDELLEAISLNCGRLQLLDISGETNLTEIGFFALGRGLCKTSLTVVDIGEPEDETSHLEIALLLENCPNIETLSRYSFVGLALTQVCDKVGEDFKCKLRYVYDTDTNEENLRVITRTCPKMESLYLESPESGILHVLNATILQELRIDDFNCDEVIQVLEKIGRNLCHLTLVKGSGNLDIDNLARFCLSLNYLECALIRGMSYSYCSPRFQYLHTLEIMQCDISNNSLMPLLRNSTQLELLAMDTTSLNDDDLKNIFTESYFSKLQDIWITSAQFLTIRTVEILVKHCPKLARISRLKGWALAAHDWPLVEQLLKGRINLSVLLNLDDCIH